MGCVFPGAEDLAAYWANIQQGVDSIGDVPPGRWDPVYFAADANGSADRFYCRRGGFVDGQARFDPLSFGVMPRAAEGADPDQLLALQVADSALRDAGLSQDGDWRQRAGVVLGRGGYITPGLARLDMRVRTAQQLVEVLRSQVPGIGEETLEGIKKSFQEQLGPYGPDTAIGLVPNLAASRIANRLDLLGPAYTVDAACASSLLAVDQACGELTSGRCDVMLAGGVHLCQDVTFWSVFTQLGALSHVGQIRPFDRRADGLLIGEGVGIVVLKRFADAERDGDRIYARLLAVGRSSDGKGTSLLEPRVDGQLLALQRAWEAAGIEPGSVGLVEAHGTATIRGDEAELTTLARFFGAANGAPRAALGSVKSMIGHTMPAAGAAGLIKAALAVHHGILPPSLHCEEPHPLLEQTRFRVPAKSEPWPDVEGTPRRAGVNAFGFGGINAHAVLESASSRRPTIGASGLPFNATGAETRLRATPAEEERWVALSAKTPAALSDALASGRDISEGGPLRLVLFNPTPERRTMAQKVVSRERPWHGHDDLWFTPRGLLENGGKTAFLFPGLEPTFDPRVEDIAPRFGLSLPVTSGFKGLEGAGYAVVAVSRMLFDALGRLKIVPQAMGGHSLGEWTGMVASEMIPPAEAQRFIDSLIPDTLEVPDVLFVAAGCSGEKATEAIRGLPDVAISHDNCPHQIILCGRSSSMETALARLREMSVLAQKLPFRSGFHSPLFAPYLRKHREHLAQLMLQRSKVPLWSATRCAPYPDEPEAIRALALEHLVHPVRFREMIDQMYADGFRFFIQVGAGSSLIGFIEDTLKGKPSLAIGSNVKQRSGLAQLRRVVAAAFISGMEVDFGPLSSRKPSAAKPLRLDVPLVRLPARADVPPAGPLLEVPPPAAGDSPVMAKFAATLRHMAKAQQEVMAALTQRAEPPSEVVEKRRISVESHPYLIDHCFYRQAPGAEVADRYPVVPGTLSVEWLRDAAQVVAGSAPVNVLEEVRAHRWLAVAPPVEVTLRAARTDPAHVAVALEGYAEATATTQAPAAWSGPPPLQDSGPPPFTAEKMYADRWMFHGPAYQAVRALTALGSDGIDGELVGSATPGAFLDCAGQLFGFWVMLRTQVDRMAFPVRMAKVEFFGPAPGTGEVLRCAVRIRELGERDVHADLWLQHLDGRPYCRITDWQDRRFDTDVRSWEVLQWPEKSLLAVPHPAYVLSRDAWRNLPSRELMARRFLRGPERAALEALTPREQGPWLNGRIALKDAGRDYLWRRGVGPLFPAQVEVVSTPDGGVEVRGPFTEHVNACVAVTEGGGVARLSAERAVGIGLRRIDKPESAPEEARLAAARDALANLRRIPTRAFVLQAVDGDRLMLEGEWIQTALEPPFAVAWS
jgi:acyl transferase domain-containing protein